MRVLVIGSLNHDVTQAIALAKEQGANVQHCKDPEAALALLCGGQGADLLLVDAAENIAALTAALKQERVAAPVAAYGTDHNIDLATRAIKQGAKEYIPLPPDAELIAGLLATIAGEGETLLYASDAMRQTVSLAERVAGSDASVLITGESGTGKEVMARFIHKNSARAGKAFIALNCAAIPENLLESELFGHEKGAFTGAQHKRIGMFEQAAGGTLLLDEISEMDIRLQAKLLRAIQEREITRVGGSGPVKVDLRILATSNRDLEQEVAAGHFRQDLFFRLNVITLHLPPLRERKADITLLSEHFLTKHAKESGIAPLPALDEKTQQALQAHRWPGNVRELENCLHRAVLLARDGVITPEDLMLQGTDAAASKSSEAVDEGDTAASLVGRTVESVEQELILHTLDHCLGNRTQAAHLLGISIRTLRNKLNAYEQQQNTAG